MKNNILILIVFLSSLFSSTVIAEEGPTDARRHMIRGVAAIEMAKSNAELALAADEFRIATELDPNLSAAWYNLGSVQAKLGKYSAAIQSYQRYLALNPKADDTQKVQDEIIKLEFRQELAAKMFPVMVHIPGKNYELGKYEVTQGQWRAVMGNNPSYFSDCGDNCPVEQVSENDIQEFLQKLNAKTGKKYRLPSITEWTYACYGGSQTKYCGGNDINAVAWYEENSNSATHPVGQKQANGYGLYDMSGNVAEFRREQDMCYKLGGSWADGSSSASPERSVGVEPQYGASGGRIVGFRLARTIP